MFRHCFVFAILALASGEACGDKDATAEKCTGSSDTGTGKCRFYPAVPGKCLQKMVNYQRPNPSEFKYQGNSSACKAAGGLYWCPVGPCTGFSSCFCIGYKPCNGLEQDVCTTNLKCDWVPGTPNVCFDPSGTANEDDCAWQTMLLSGKEGCLADPKCAFVSTTQEMILSDGTHPTCEKSFLPSQCKTMDYGGYPAPDLLKNGMRGCQVSASADVVFRWDVTLEFSSDVNKSVVVDNRTLIAAKHFGIPVEQSEQLLSEGECTFNIPAPPGGAVVPVSLGTYSTSLTVVLDEDGQTAFGNIVCEALIADLGVGSSELTCTVTKQGANLGRRLLTETYHIEVLKDPSSEVVKPAVAQLQVLLKDIGDKAGLEITVVEKSSNDATGDTDNSEFSAATSLSGVSMMAVSILASLVAAG